ncbi:hypothetical protein [Neobacillus sp. Marseille-QA0830]
MTLPQNFDQNEWFIILWLVISCTIVWFLPKRYPLSITILMMVYSATVARFSDHLLSIPQSDLYDVMDGPKFELFDLFSYALYAPFGYLFVYFFERLNIKGLWIAVYIVICSFGGTGFEWIAKYFNVFTYKGWLISYSFTVYLIVQTFTVLFYKYIKYVHKISIEK